MNRLSVLFVLWAFTQCSGREPAADEAQVALKGIQGLWINQTYLDSLKKNPTTRFNNSYGITELYFSDKFKIAYSLNGDWEPKDAVYSEQDGKVLLNYRKKASDSIITMYKRGNQLVIEPEYGGVRRIFVRPIDSLINKNFSDKYVSAYEKSINRALLSGKWKVVQFSPVPPERGEAIILDKYIQFSSDGKVDGMGMYKNYYICSEGDCKRYCDEMSMVYLSMVRDQPGGKWYCWEIKNGRLYIYHAKSLEWMSNHPDIQPEMLWMVLERERNN